jgi:hypothetical protein
VGKASRAKGSRRELELTHLGQENGFAVTKRSGMYVSGHDLDWPLCGKDWRVEVKSRASGCRTLYRWLEDRDAVLVKADRERWLLVVPLVDALPVMKIAEARK